jgi:23S rRNA pseudouridine955/2504/2580 synthase
MDKHYLVAVKGRFRNTTQRVRAALSKREGADGAKRVFVSESGQEAETVFTRRSRGAEASLLEARLVTGRTHQIRVHLAHLRHPVLGDDKYGDFELNKRLRREGLHRMFLHAARLAFTHPQTGAPVVVESPLPADLEAFRMRHLAQEPG